MKTEGKYCRRGKNDREVKVGDGRLKERGRGTREWNEREEMEMEGGRVNGREMCTRA